MKSMIALITLSCALSLPSLAHGETPPSDDDELDRGIKGFEMGIRSGYAFSSGKLLEQGEALSEAVPGQIPFWLDLGYRIIPEIYVGAYAQYGIGITKGCPNTSNCSASDVRFGVNVQYHPIPERRVDPWVGFGFGYEFFNTSETFKGTQASVEGSAKGFELANFQAGVDFRPSSAFRLGPFVSASIDRTTSISIECTPPQLCASLSSSDFDRAIHTWIFLGLRGAFIIGSQG